MQKLEKLLFLPLLIAIGLQTPPSMAQFQVYSDSYAPNQIPPLYTIGYRFDGSQIVSNGVFADSSVPSFAQLQRDQHRFSNYPQFVDYLFSTAPALRSQFVLLHQSASLQLASKSHPRILVFGGGKVFIFSEHPENKNLRVEMMEVDAHTRDVNLREIVFNEKGAQFDPNPKSCVACHGSPARPVWDPYDFWPNAFGSLAGSLRSREEIQAYKELIEHKKNSPMLAKLILPDQPNLTDEQISPLTYALYQTHFYNWWKRKLALYPPQSNLDGFRYALLSTLHLCQFRSTRDSFYHEKAAVLDLFVNARLSEEQKLKLDTIFNTLNKDRSQFKSYLESAYNFLFPGSDVDFSFFSSRLQDETRAHAFLYWIFEMMGIDATDLSVSLTKNNYLLSTPTHFSFDLLTVLYEARPDLFYDLEVRSQDLSTGHPGWIKLDCDQLKNLARAQQPKIADESFWLTPNRVRYSQPPINRCAKCHVEGADPLAPKIPFHDSQLMARKLRSTKLGAEIQYRIHHTGEDQMPPRHPLTSVEKEAVSAYIEALSY